MTLHRLSLVFCQAATIALGALFVVVTLRPEWLGVRELGQVIVNQIAPGAIQPGAAPGAYAGAVRRAAPAVVNIYTSRQVAVPRHPLMDDPVFREFFG